MPVMVTAMVVPKKISRLQVVLVVGFIGDLSRGCTSFSGFPIDKLPIAAMIVAHVESKRVSHSGCDCFRPLRMIRKVF